MTLLGIWAEILGSMNSAKYPRFSVYSFDDVVVDCAAQRVLKDRQPRKITPRAFDLLVYFLEHAGRMADKQELFDQVWKGTFVTDNALTRSVAEVRRVLGDRALQPRYIETVTKRGYRFIAPVAVSETRTLGAPAHCLKCTVAPSSAPRSLPSRRRNHLVLSALTLLILLAFLLLPVSVQ